MTENEAKYIIIQNRPFVGSKELQEAVNMAIKALEEIQKYRAIGTIDECRTAVERMKPKKVLYRKQHYGTPWLCPECEADQIKVEFFNEDGTEPQEKHTFCWECGTKLDWSE